MVFTLDWTIKMPHEGLSFETQIRDRRFMIGDDSTMRDDG